MFNEDYIRKLLLARYPDKVPTIITPWHQNVAKDLSTTNQILLSGSNSIFFGWVNLFSFSDSDPLPLQVFALDDFSSDVPFPLLIDSVGAVATNPLLFTRLTTSSDMQIVASFVGYKIMLT